jgi:F-type H+-transporting ATPase subunit gamma
LRKALFPIDPSELPPVAADRPLTQLPSQILLNALFADHIFAAICQTALYAFAAENEARLRAMTAAGENIARELKDFEAVLRRVRQEQITAEIIELGTGALSLRPAR